MGAMSSTNSESRSQQSLAAQFQDPESDVDALRLGNRPQASRSYLVQINGLTLLVYGTHLTKQPSDSVPHLVHVGGASETTIGEAFAFLHGDYEPEVVNACLGCGSTTGRGEDKQCSCPVGTYTKSTEWPDIPERKPRGILSGELITKPSGTL